jgi:hypothetical protein
MVAPYQRAPEALVDPETDVGVVLGVDEHRRAVLTRP